MWEFTVEPAPGQSTDCLVDPNTWAPLSPDAQGATAFVSLSWRTFLGRRPLHAGYLYATPALAGPPKGITSVLLNPTSRHHLKKSAAVKSNASPNSINILSDIINPNAFSRLASSIKFSITTNAPPGGKAS